jgi:hypothetical protein
VDEDVANLKALASIYRQKTGQLPNVRGFRFRRQRDTPAELLGRTDKLTADGRIEMRNPDDRPFIQKGLPPGYIPPKTPKFLPSDQG